MVAQGSSFNRSLYQTVPVSFGAKSRPRRILGEGRSYSNEITKAFERRRRKIGWLSKFAGWSGHAALVSNCPEYFAAEGVA